MTVIQEQYKRLEEIKEDIMVARHYQDVTNDDQVYMAMTKLITILKLARAEIKSEIS